MTRVNLWERHAAIGTGGPQGRLCASCPLVQRAGRGHTEFLGRQICTSRMLNAKQRRPWGAFPKVPEWLEMDNRRYEGRQKTNLWSIEAEKER